jgi:hypothetical protein
MSSLEFLKLTVQIIVGRSLANEHSDLAVPVNLHPANFQSCGFGCLDGKPQVTLAKRNGTSRHGNKPRKQR